jgi:hypothetical protein
MTMRRGHHTSRVLKAMGAGVDEAIEADIDPVEALEDHVRSESD